MWAQIYKYQLFMWKVGHDFRAVTMFFLWLINCQIFAKSSSQFDRSINQLVNWQKITCRLLIADNCWILSRSFPIKMHFSAFSILKTRIYCFNISFKYCVMDFWLKTERNWHCLGIWQSNGQQFFFFFLTFLETKQQHRIISNHL